MLFTGELGYDGFSVSVNYITALPNIASIQNPDIIVSFKSLSKKDPKTKEKALQELLSLSTIDEATIEAWIQIYPKLALDNSRNVRQMSHQVQGLFLKIVGGKAFSKYLKSSLPIWLMGTYDTDKSVCSVARNTLLESFQGDSSKVEKVWVLFHEQIINLIGTIVNIESAETLSDKRYTSESEMIVKYDRALIACIHMLMKMPEEQTILEQESLWDHLSTSLKEETMDLGLFKALLLLLDSLSNDAMGKLYKMISKKVFKIKLKPNKVSGSIVYSSVIVLFWQIISKFTSYGIDHNLKKNFWEFGGNKASTRFYEYLKIGPCNSDPLYYTSVIKVFKDLQELNLVVDFSNVEEYKFIDELLLKQYNSSVGKLKAAALDCILKISQMFEENHGFDELLYHVVKTLPRLNNDILVVLSQNKNDTMIEGFKNVNERLMAKLDIKFVQNYFEVLVFLHLQSFMEDIVKDSIANLDEDEGNIASSFAVIKWYLHYEKKPINEVVEFLSILPSFIEEDHIDPVIELFNIAMKQNLIDDVAETINDFYLKLSMVKPGKIPFFLQSLDIKIDAQKFPEIYEYLVGLSKKNVENVDMIVRLTQNKDILMHLVQSPTNDEEIIRVINKYNLLPIIVDENISQILHIAWSSLDIALLTQLKNFESLYLSSMVDYLKSIFIDSDLSKLIDFISQGPLPMDIFEHELENSRVDIYSVAISNPLESAVYLTGFESGKLNDFVPIIGKVLSQIDEEHHVTLIARECISDYLLVKETPAEEVLNILMNLDKKIIACYEKYSLKELVSEDGPLKYFNQLSEDNDFYAARVIKRLIENASEVESLSTFESLEINYNKLMKFPIKFIATISGFGKFLGSKNLDRIKNYVFSEILSVKKDDEILTEGLKWISLCLPFFNTDFDADVFPVHKLTLVLNLIDEWLNSSVAYDDKFIDMRVQLTRFMGYIHQKQLTIPDNFQDLALKLLENNMEISQLEPQRLDLLYYTLKFYLKIGNGHFEQELLELLLTYNCNKQNQACSLVESELQRTLQQTNIGIKTLQSKKDSIFRLFAESKSTSTQRICAWFLQKIISTEQPEFVVEYQLSKDDSLQAKIPQILMGIISKDDGNHAKYFWSWYLIFEFFEDVTLRIKTDYVNQLLENKELFILFDYIFEVLDFDDKFISGLIVDSDNVIPNYDLIETGKREILEDELKYLVVNIYYKCLQHCGSQVQLWFKEIRDRQFKNKVEKFTVKYVSSLLISKILNQVSDQKTKIEGKEENMNIKVNQVTNEIRTTYVIDDQKMEMMIKIPHNYPLDNVSVEGPLRLGVKENQWKAWLLASQRVISLTNGSIIESIELFCKNVNLHFSGFEDCAICYSILHQDLSLPSKTCPTCSNKFHAACLYKWFKSSGSSTCPLCRSAFNFRK